MTEEKRNTHIAALKRELEGVKQRLAVLEGDAKAAAEKQVSEIHAELEAHGHKVTKPSDRAAKRSA